MKVEVKTPEGLKIDAIRTRRFLTDEGLKEAKDFIESLVVLDSYWYQTETSKTMQEIKASLSVNQSESKVTEIKETPKPTNITINIIGNKTTMTINSPNITATITINTNQIPDVINTLLNKFVEIDV